MCSVEWRESWAGVLPGGDSPPVRHAGEGRERGLWPAEER